MKDKFYVYGHYKLGSMIPFYIGKGCGNRAFDNSGRTDYWSRIVNKHGIRVEIMYDNLSESLAFQMEKDFIKMYGRQDLGCGPLINMTDGGDQPPSWRGKKHSEESKIKMKKSKSAEHRKHMSESQKGEKSCHYGKRQSPERIEQRLIKTRGKKRTVEQRKNISDAVMGKKRSEETKQKMRKPKSERHREKIQAAKIGRRVTNETKEKKRLIMSQKIWIRNIILNENKRIDKSSVIPNGWILGRNSFKGKEK